MANLNSQRIAAASAVAQLYNPKNATYVKSIISEPYCAVTIWETYSSNATALLDYLCCQGQKFMYPGILGLMEQVFSQFLSVSPRYTLANSPSQYILNLQSMIKYEQISYHSLSCIDDQSLLIPQRSVRRANEAEIFLNTLSALYATVQMDAQSLSSCIGSNFEYGCLTNSTINTLPDESLFQYQLINAQYQQICSAEALALFDLSRTNTPC